MAEQAFHNSDDPADLPLFATAPAPRPGRVRSTFSMRIDPVATGDGIGGVAAGGLCSQECAAGVGCAQSQSLGAGRGGLVAGGAAASAGIGTVERVAGR
jgi:hypothetical protein